MFQFERKQWILDELMSEGQIKIIDCARSLGVSYATLHRDLLDMAEEGLVKKVRGGAVLTGIARSETHFDMRLGTMSKEKEEIAIRSVGFIQDDTSIFLDHSTSAFFLARELKKRDFRNLTLLTNSLAIPSEVYTKNGIHIVVTGGVVEHEFRALSGSYVIELLKHLHLDQIFASVGFISPERGLMTQIPFVRELLPLIFECGGQINILADHSKFLEIGTYHIGELNSSLRIFTDKGLCQALREKIEQKGPKVII